MNSSSSLSRSALLAYGSLAIPLAFAGMPLYLHAPDFYATEYGVSLSTIGMVLLLVRVFDAVQDPFIGIASDHLRRHRLTLMLLSMLALAVSFLMLFTPSSEHTVVWFAASMVLATTAYSVLSINLSALGGMWGNAPTTRTRIAGWREALGLVGLLLASILPTVLMQSRGKEESFMLVAGILCFLLLLCGAAFAWWYRAHRQIEVITTAANDNPAPRWHVLRPQRAFFAVYGVSALASAIPVVLVMFFIRDRLEAESYTGMFLLLYFLSGALSMALWQPIARRIGAYRAWLAGMLLAIVSFIWAFSLEAGDVVAYAIICLTSGLALGAELALPPAILATRIEENRAEQHTSLHFAMLVFMAKAALALASGLVLPALDASGYTPTGDNSMAALAALSTAYALVPCLIKAVAALMLWRLLLPTPPLTFTGDLHAKTVSSPQPHGHHHVS